MLGRTNIQWTTAAKPRSTFLSLYPSRYSGKEIEIRRSCKYTISHFGCFPPSRGRGLGTNSKEHDNHKTNTNWGRSAKNILTFVEIHYRKTFAGLHNSLISQNTKHKSLAWIACPHSNQDFDFRTVNPIGYSAGSSLTCILLLKKTRPF